MDILRKQLFVLLNNKHNSVKEVRCDSCSSKLFHIKDSQIEIKCRKCKSITKLEIDENNII